MRSTTRLAISVAAAVLAFFGNYVYLAGQLQPELFVSVASNISPSHNISEADLKSIAISGELAALRKSLIPWEERSTILERQPYRTIEAGRLLTWEDVRPSGGGHSQQGESPIVVPAEGLQVGFLRVGDRVRVVGARFRQGEKDEMTQLEQLGPCRVLWIDDQFSPLEERKEPSGQGRVRELGLVLEPKSQGSQAEQEADMAKRYATLLRAANKLDGYRIVQITSAP